MEDPILRIPVKDLFSGGNGLAEVRVYKDRFDIQVYFAGPDLRYNGDLCYIQDKRIDEYIESVQSNWQELQKMKALNLEGTYTKKGKSDMLISVTDGKYLHLYVISNYGYEIRKSLLRNEKDIDQFISTLTSAKKQAKTIQASLQA